MKSRLFVPLTALILLAESPYTVRSLSGVVTDQNARPIREAAVLIENERTLAVRSCITGDHGEFHFSELNPDNDYGVQAEFDGIRSSKKVLSQFDSRHKATMKLVIRLPRRLN